MRTGEDRLDGAAAAAPDGLRNGLRQGGRPAAAGVKGLRERQCSRIRRAPALCGRETSDLKLHRTEELCCVSWGIHIVECTGTDGLIDMLSSFHPLLAGRTSFDILSHCVYYLTQMLGSSRITTRLIIAVQSRERMQSSRWDSLSEGGVSHVTRRMQRRTLPRWRSARTRWRRRPRRPGRSPSSGTGCRLHRHLPFRIDVPCPAAAFHCVGTREHARDEAS